MVQWFLEKSYYPKVTYFTRLRFFGAEVAANEGVMIFIAT